MEKQCLLIVAVEPSADEIGAALVDALQAQLGWRPRLIGVGGPALAARGLDSHFDPAALAVLGIFNAVAAYPQVLRRARDLAALAVREAPSGAILIDAWGFNLRVARALRDRIPSLSLIKYVAPQVWATRPGRARTLAKAVDRLLTIHVFDARHFEREGLPTTFVGNPALNRDLSNTDPARFRSRRGIDHDAPLLLLLPGSRDAEVDRLLPRFRDAVELLLQNRPDLQVVIALADRVAARSRREIAAWRFRPQIVEGEAARFDAMRAATVALACSGTVTTELALAGCPMIVAYRLGNLTHLVARFLIRTPYITLLNVAARAFIAPERVQAACVGPVLAADIGRLLDSKDARKAQVAAQTESLHVMRGGIEDPAAAAATAVVDALGWRAYIPE